MGWQAAQITESAAVAREVMEYLLARLKDTDPGTVNAAPPALHTANGALFAFQRVGLVSDEAARAWRESIDVERQRLTAVIEDEFQHPAPARRYQPPPVERASIDDVLERQLFAVDRRRQVEASVGRRLHPSNNPAREAAQAVLGALVELGLVSELDERRWSERFERAADPDAEPLRVYTAQTLKASFADSHRDEPALHQDEPLVHPRPRCSFEQLLDVIVIRAADDGEARLEFIELYSDGFAITWTRAAQERRSSEHARLPRAEATDDVGTFYFQSGGTGSSGGSHRSRGRQAFAPRIPNHAAELRIRIGDEAFVVPLPDSSIR
jgi:hypothetical protein